MTDTQIEQTQLGLFGAPCAHPHCSRELEPLSKVFRDLLTDRPYCEQHGKTLRFHRKKARQRGEALPITHADVDARIQELMKRWQS